MSAFPCVSNFKTPYDEQPAWAHCSGRHNVSFGGIEWTVDFDYNAPCIEVGGVDVTEQLKSADRIIELAIRAHDEEDV